MRMKIDGAGRVVIPAAIRRSFGIGPHGGDLELLVTPDGVLLRPLDGSVATREQRGLTVVSVGRRVERTEVADAVRHDRDDRPSAS